MHLLFKTSVRKKREMYSALIKSSRCGAEVFLGEFPCQSCARRVVAIALRCFNELDMSHGHDAQAISDARALGIAEALEDFLGFELSESEAFRLEAEWQNELAQYAVKKAMDQKVKELARKKEFFQAKQLLRTIPEVVVHYPPIPIATIPMQKDCPLIPQSSGVYFAWQNDAVAYVGQSINLRARTSGGSHAKIFPDDRLSWLEFPRDVLNFAESYYIGIACPYRNFGTNHVPTSFEQEDQGDEWDAELFQPLTNAQRTKSNG